LAAAALNLPFEIPIFAILLIVLGIILLGRAMRQTSASE
jgi:ABC-type dipeptide/oligopeptide/nickel transport system permease subunit